MQLNRGLLGGSENLIDVEENKQYTSSTEVVFDISPRIKLEIGKTYTVTVNMTNTTYATKYLIVNYNGTHRDVVNDTSGSGTISFTFTVTTNDDVWLRTYQPINNVCTIHWVMLNAGSTALPYKKRSGNIVFEADIEPTLLWENSSPTSAFASQTITTADMSSFKYIVFEYKLNNASSSNTQFMKVKYNSAYSYISHIDETQKGYFRNFYIASSTTIEVSGGYYNGSETNLTIIPVAIYGTNIL